MKMLTPIETDEYSLVVVECNCGMHMGFDFSYIDQMGDIFTPCPNCGETMSSSEALMNED